MGDASTHLIFNGGYWHLCAKEHGHWVDTKAGFEIVCEIGCEEKAIELKDL